MQIIVDQQLVYYTTQGEGKPVIMLHGWGDSGISYAELSKTIAKNLQAITIDLPGFGGSQAPPSAWGLTDYAAFVAAVLQKLHVKPYAIIGHSNGGAIAIRALGSSRIDAEKLVLLAASGVRPSQPLKRTAHQSLAKIGKVIAAPLPTQTRQKLRKSLYQRIDSDFLAVPSMEETFKKIVRDDIEADAERITIPTLLVWGDQDQATPLAQGERLNQLISNSRLTTLSGVGHFLLQERSPDLQRLITEFLK